MLLLLVGVPALAAAASLLPKKRQEPVGGVSTEALLTQLESESFFERLAAKEELARRKDPASLPRLVNLLNDERPDMRAEAVEIIGRFNDPSLLATVAAVLEKDPAWQVRFGAVNALASLRDRRGEPFLAATLAGDEWPAVRAQAALALSVFPGCDAAHALLTALTDPDPRVVTMARGTLRDITSSREAAAWDSWVEANCPLGPDAGREAPPAQSGPIAATSTIEGEGDQYLAWASFRPGSWVIRKSEGKLAFETKEILRSVGPYEVVIEIQTSIQGFGAQPAKAKAIPASSGDRPKTESAGEYSEEALTLNDRELRCRARRSSDTAVWYCDAIPGGLAQYEFTDGMGRLVTRIRASDWEALR